MIYFAELDRQVFSNNPADLQVLPNGVILLITWGAIYSFIVTPALKLQLISTVIQADNGFSGRAVATPVPGGYALAVFDAIAPALRWYTVSNNGTLTVNGVLYGPVSGPKPLGVIGGSLLINYTKTLNNYYEAVIPLYQTLLPIGVNNGNLSYARGTCFSNYLCQPGYATYAFATNGALTAAFPSATYAAGIVSVDYATPIMRASDNNGVIYSVDYSSPYSVSKSLFNIGIPSPIISSNGGRIIARQGNSFALGDLKNNVSLGTINETKYPSNTNYLATWLSNVFVFINASTIVLAYLDSVPLSFVGINAELQRANGPVPLTRLRNLSKVYPFFGRK